MIASRFDSPYPYSEVAPLTLPSGHNNGGFLDSAIDFAAVRLHQARTAFVVGTRPSEAMVDSILDLADLVEDFHCTLAEAALG